MTDKKYKVIVSDRAKRMLGAHIRFIAQVNKDAASTKKKEIIAAIRSLNHMPQRFPFFEEAYIPPNKYHKMFIEKWYLVLYQIQDDTVYVEYIVDCRKDYNWLIHSGMLETAMTSMELPGREMGQRAADMILEDIEAADDEKPRCSTWCSEQS